ncbi:DUF961 family protein [Liquorilactobacillus oeni]|uniref:Conjugative transposon protein n=1 Tax=Liquorilactobacillus oeni DSM 19972 TaxID=1423777 RepID=A0A0R1M8F2_9LACO|nr:DUF961 family protein [Liquorilactobacillus oeni]KRL04396.1 hypothetical protein FD46_GL001524 [Liquorilactobacillus oeni DSM 19972]
MLFYYSKFERKVLNTPLKYVIPTIETFGKLTFEGKDREVTSGRSRIATGVVYNLLSEKQAELIEVQIPARAGSKTFETDTEIELVNPKLEPTGRSTGDEAIASWKLTAENIKKKGDK